MSKQTERWSFMEPIERADAIASYYHEGITDKVGVPYIEHPRAVAQIFWILAQANNLTPEEIHAGTQAALLHDVIEDSKCAYFTLEMAGVHPDVIEVVRLMTRTPEVPNSAYYVGLRNHRIGRLVKYADILHNRQPQRRAALDRKTDNRLDRKYEEACQALQIETSPAKWWLAMESVSHLAMVMHNHRLPETQRRGSWRQGSVRR